MPDETPQQHMPPLREVRYLNTNIAVGEADESGARELTFVVGHTAQGVPELETFIITTDAQKYITEQFAGGITIAQPGDVPPAPPEE